MIELRLAVERAGNQNKLAEALGVHKSTISQWFRRSRVPTAQAAKIKDLYGIDVALFERVLIPERSEL